MTGSAPDFPDGSGRPTVLVFDSGVGGLTVYRAIQNALPDARFVYVADDAAFPYGRLSEAELVQRVMHVFDWLVPLHRPSALVIACNTASTLVLPHLRSRFDLPVVGTVPAIKTGAERTRSGIFAVLATPGTISRDYTRSLIAQFAPDKQVELVGSTALAGIAEKALRGETIDLEAVAAEIAPCFIEVDGMKTDMIVLGCTHYPLLLEAMRQVSLWPVEWIDPAPAIAKRVVSLLAPGIPTQMHGKAEKGVIEPWPAIFTSGKAIPNELGEALDRFGLQPVPQTAFAYAA